MNPTAFVAGDSLCTIAIDAAYTSAAMHDDTITTGDVDDNHDEEEKEKRKSVYRN